MRRNRYRTFFVVAAMLVLLMSSRYPLVGRGDSWLSGTPNSLLAISIALGVIGAGISFFVQPLDTSKRPFFAALWRLAFGCVGAHSALMFANGALDFSAPQAHPTVILEKTSSQGRHGTRRIFYVTDWRAPAGRVRVPAWGTSYDQEVGTPVTVTTKRGLLGFERVVGVG